MRSLFSIALLGVALTTAGLADPVTLYDNGAPLGSPNFNSGGPIHGANVAGDDFILTDASIVTGVQFFGFSVDSTAVSALTYYFYTAVDSLPGILLGSGSATDLSTAPDGRLVGYVADFNLASPLSLAAGRYFLVLGQAGPNSQVFDNTASIAPGTAVGVFRDPASVSAGTFQSRNADLAFSILGIGSPSILDPSGPNPPNPTPGPGGTTIVSAPEPSSLILSGSTLAGLLVLMRRRSARR